MFPVICFRFAVLLKHEWTKSSDCTEMKLKFGTWGKAMIALVTRWASVMVVGCLS